MLAATLITWSWYLSGIVPRAMAAVTGEQISDGLQLLNDILQEKNSGGEYLPYLQLNDLPAVVNQEEYFVSGLVYIETLTVNQDNIRYSMMLQNREYYFGAPRVNNVASIPGSYYSERVLGGTNLWVYWEPSQSDFVFQIKGRYEFPLVTLMTELETFLPTYYEAYLKYKLAERMCDFYGMPFRQANRQRLLELDELVSDINPIDLTCTKVSNFTPQGGVNWPQVNIGKGWSAS